jgi:hypothetical protein
MYVIKKAEMVTSLIASFINKTFDWLKYCLELMCHKAIFKNMCHIMFCGKGENQSPCLGRTLAVVLSTSSPGDMTQFQRGESIQIAMASFINATELMMEKIYNSWPILLPLKNILLYHLC